MSNVYSKVVAFLMSKICK